MQEILSLLSLKVHLPPHQTFLLPIFFLRSQRTRMWCIYHCWLIMFLRFRETKLFILNTNGNHHSLTCWPPINHIITFWKNIFCLILLTNNIFKKGFILRSQVALILLSLKGKVRFISQEKEFAKWCKRRFQVPNLLEFSICQSSHYFHHHLLNLFPISFVRIKHLIHSYILSVLP